MKKIISVLSFAFIAAAMVNFIGVSYFKQTNIASFKNYSIFYALLNNEKTSKETKEKIIELTEMYKTFESNGMKNPKEMIEFHVGSIRKGTPTIGTYYQLYKFGKHLDEQVKTGENILRDDK